MGRPTKLKPALLGMITQAVALGVPVVSAGGHATACPGRACLEWLQRGQGTHPTRQATKAYVAFVEAIEKARAQDEVRQGGAPGAGRARGARSRTRRPRRTPMVASSGK